MEGLKQVKRRQRDHAQTHGQEARVVLFNDLLQRLDEEET